jgi:hypothetical protein
MEAFAVTSTFCPLPSNFRAVYYISYIYRGRKNYKLDLHRFTAFTDSAWISFPGCLEEREAVLHSATGSCLGPS